VPERYPKDQVLASWVQRQRINRRKGKLTSERVRLLEQVGFRWAIYKADKRVASGGERASEREPAFKRVPEREREKLNCLSEGVYVQYGGKGAEPAELKEYVRSHRGNYPPYIPLPRGKTTFVLGERYAPGARKVVWNGNGPLPADVLRHVRKQGVLPNHG
jgi:hypothetical protein